MIEQGFCYPHEDIAEGVKPVFLMGPLRNACDWQREAVQYVPKDKNIILINPRLHDSQRKGQAQDPGDISQRPWEEKYLKRCMGDTGAICIWIPRRLSPQTGMSPDFGDNTAREIGYLGALMESNVDLVQRVVFGYDDPLEKNFITDLAFLEERGLPKSQIFTSLQASIKKACEIALS